MLESKMTNSPNFILHNAKVFTVDSQRPWAQAIAIKGRRFIAVGEESEILQLKSRSTVSIDLSGRLILPGLCDAHIHFYDWSLSRKQVQLVGCKSRAEMLERIRLWTHKKPTHDWLLGRGWNENDWDDRALPTRDDLDFVTGSNRPALFWRTDMHAAVANSCALKLAGITADTRDPDGGIIGRHSDGKSNGLLWELAINLVMRHIPVPRSEELESALLDGMRELNRLGVTAVHDQRMKDQNEGPVALNAYQRLRQDGQLLLRVNCNIAAHDLPHLAALGLRSGFGDEYLRLGHIKFFADGTMGSRTAWMLNPYQASKGAKAANFGISVSPPEKMAAEIRRAVESGFSVSVHAIGDKANQVVLDIIEEVSQTLPPSRIPHRIEHVQIISPEDFTRLAPAKITASVQPVHAIDDIEVAERVLGKRANRAYRFQSLAGSGALLALGSDAPVADPNPFLGFHAALCRRRPQSMDADPWFADERLSLEQIIHGYTMGAARAAGWEKVIGSITPNKLADLIILDRDLFEMAEQGVRSIELADTRVIATMFDGRFIHNSI
jgi:predicted amidohydrolase YtcJ